MKMVLWWLHQQPWSGKGCSVDFDMIDVESMCFGNEKQRLFSKLHRKNLRGMTVELHCKVS